ncbi:PaaX family transcriptional regulator C-terminal domain-containing protein [Loigolactobacillus bifermentans]|uniref:Transcriptional regulator, PaaX family protein n=1 Tax=Loigolactobacillus bifermentans DSM 20003 TaxID=1423726 RepID=A0A0R1GLI1_9LACO|nr:PaaX family transcriptional regulator C-terminal domain-containing protein [Loigolactobacillus bifermentans]KRK34681.1 transcriptional regulator, PaaX family protein [Loigolactobacillus bifermentans DSM 20003]QGG61054.1 DeoR family transcriptional regulator [Loigolactobacillus bifermentans]
MQSIEKQILHLVDVGGQVSARTLVQIYTQRHYSEMTIRNNLSALKNDGQITNIRRGWYAITAAGRQHLADINQKYLHYHAVFAGDWWVVLLRIPETQRKAKVALKTALSDYGFAAYQSNIYVSPWPYGDEILAVAQAAGVAASVKVTSARFEKTPITPAEAYELWHLSDLARMYRRELDWLRQKQPVLANLLIAQDDNALLQLYLDVGNHLNQMFLQDPVLPKRLLPRQWIGEQTLQAFIQAYDQIAAGFPTDSLNHKFMAPMFSERQRML